MAAFKKRSGFVIETHKKSDTESVGSSQECGGIVKDSDPPKFVSLISKSADQLLGKIYIMFADIDITQPNLTEPKPQTKYPPQNYPFPKKTTPKKTTHKKVSPKTLPQKKYPRQLPPKDCSQKIPTKNYP